MKRNGKIGSSEKKTPLRVGTLFSGIGAFEQALKQLKVPTDIVFACDNGERYLEESFESIIDATRDMSIAQRERYVDDLYEQTGKRNFVRESYEANYGKMGDNWHNDVRFMNGTKYANQVDIVVGGSPCQSFSVIGRRAGLDDVRGTLFYDYARIIRESSPRVFIFENVPGMLSHDKGRTWKVIKEVFESLDYKVHYSVLDAKDFGIPQHRKRLFVVGFKDKAISFDFPKPIPLGNTMFDYLEDEVSPEHYLGQKGFDFVTDPTHPNRSKVNCDVIKTQKANQQFNWNGDFVFEPLDMRHHTEEILKRAYVGEWHGQRGVARKLTNRECLRLMGFSDSFKIVVPPVQSYRQAGNSIVVNVLKEIVKNILKALDEEH